MITTNTALLNAPIWREAKKLSKEDKIHLITLLSISLADTATNESSSDKTRQMIAKHAGSWKGNESAEEVINNIYASRNSSGTPLSLD